MFDFKGFKDLNGKEINVSVATQSFEDEYDDIKFTIYERPELKFLGFHTRSYSVLYKRSRCITKFTGFKEEDFRKAAEELVEKYIEKQKVDLDAERLRKLISKGNE